LCGLLLHQPAKPVEPPPVTMNLGSPPALPPGTDGTVLVPQDAPATTR
jgi:hypothetical protein